jgi:Helicase conserved C-terminal domain
MIAEGHKVASLHGAKDAAERDAIIDNFREGREKVLITTNVIARGIDILQVNMVVNYDLPLMNDRGRNFSNDPRPDVETYIHRIGKCFFSPRYIALIGGVVQVELGDLAARGSQSILCITSRHGFRWSRSRSNLTRRSSG